ncbi:hypothetical protein FSP39_001678 [Pinctada imbricata]|uniref:Uncharacterized protein n=1 Tax=Pinctada imbricata TaxID=66713 RepID=A0AA88Y9G6_PINIB|nr:hypothetical protein FSP39_001678 [Pinctada imbricata]
MSPKKGKKNKKRKNNSQNISSERVNKKRVTSSQSENNQSRNISAIMNGNVNSTYNLQSPGMAIVQQSTPIQGPTQAHVMNTAPMTPMSMSNQPYYTDQVNLSPIRSYPPYPEINSKIDNLTLKLDSICEKLGKLDLIDQRLKTVEDSVRTSKDEIQQMKTKISGVEESLTFFNNKFEENKTELKELKESVKQIDVLAKSLSSEQRDIRDQFDSLVCDYSDLKERHIDLQSRSMRDNLIFNGIIEAPEENTENVLVDFLKQEMDIELDPTKFHRVHRMGRGGNGKTRPIVAKFVLYKEKELVRKAAATKLRGKPYGIGEQYPREINDRRKELYPHYKRAKQQGLKAVMSGDRLYINNRLFDPREQGSHHPMDTGTNPGSARGTTNGSGRTSTRR